VVDKRDRSSGICIGTPRPGLFIYSSDQHFGRINSVCECLRRISGFGASLLSEFLTSVATKVVSM
jgi:hypothetical protein